MSNLISKNRYKVGIVIDYTLRFPDFTSCYNQMKKDILEGEMAKETENKNTNSTYFKELSQNSREAYDFYIKTPTPVYGPNFDYTFRSYFFSLTDLTNFLEAWVFNLYSPAETLKKINTEFINICQSKLCDVVLIDKGAFGRKIPNTLAFLSKSRVIFKELIYIGSSDELVRRRPEFFDIFDPLEQFKNEKIDYTLQNNKFLDWLEGVEKGLVIEKEKENKPKRNKSKKNKVKVRPNKK